MAVQGGRGGNLRLQAVQYARQYLAPWAGQYREVRYGGTGGEGWQPGAAGSAVRATVPCPLGWAVHGGALGVQRVPEAVHIYITNSSSGYGLPGGS